MVGLTRLKLHAQIWIQRFVQHILKQGTTRSQRKSLATRERQEVIDQENNKKNGCLVHLGPNLGGVMVELGPELKFPD